MRFSFKGILPHLLVFIGFCIVSLLYFSPVLQGKEIFQSDIKHYIGMSKQQKDFQANTGEETYWTNSAFGGMPTYQLGANYPHNYIKKLDHLLRFLPRPADYLFLYFLGFYMLLLVLKVDYKLAALGALAFGFSTYLIIFIGVGHNSKAHAIAYMPMVLGGILLTFRKKYILGALLTVVALALEINANHFQMTYYLLLLVIVLGIVYLIDAYKKKEIPHYFKSIGFLVGAAILAVGLNASILLATQEYVKESTRGQSELTINADGSAKDITSGLSREYITEYSNGILETFSYFMPRFLGGGSYEDVGKDSESFALFTTMGLTAAQAEEQAQNMPTYWGDMTIVEAPAYIGAVIIFLFVLGLFLVKGRLKWWLVGGSLLTLFLSYGKNLGFLTDFFIDYVPLYNKFRAVSSIQVIVDLCIPVLAIFALVRIFNDFVKDEEKIKALKYSAFIVGGLALIFLLFGTTLFDFVGARDGFYREQYGEQFIRAVREDRISIFRADALRTLILVALTAAAIWFYLKKKLSQNTLIIVAGILIIFDLVSVDRRYVNNDNFVAGIQVQKPYTANNVDQEILKDSDYFRVFDLSTEGSRAPAKASYYHNSLSGYHAAKLGRYSEIFDFYISRNNINVLNMLNTKYIIAEDEKGQMFPYVNTDANGNAWFVSEINHLETANQEILKLDSLDTKTIAITTDESLKIRPDRFKVDSTATIILEEHQPNYLKYKSNNSNEGFAVFSEIYYPNGWISTIDGKEVPHYRVDYVLRGLDLPAGSHTIEFRFDPEVVKTGGSIALASSIIFGLLLIGGLYFEFKKEKNEEEENI
ncbi:membrane protein YfhO [Flavobacteriaceae bacterium MAR_2010_188]|nr:membrane protein YfhO [Flavobacteriaceae bacterium MAR_2010_188]